MIDLYLALKQFVQGDDPNKRLSSTVTFGLGAVAGLITTYASMPFEYVGIWVVFMKVIDRFQCYQNSNAVP